METTIDRAGRIVIPKAVRDSAGLVAGMTVSVTERDGVVELRPRQEEAALVLENGVLVFTGKPVGDIGNVVRDQRDARLRTLRARIEG